jgi:uncharacterized membrane protein (UPF0127 family)
MAAMSLAGCSPGSDGATGGSSSTESAASGGAETSIDIPVDAPDGSFDDAAVTGDDTADTDAVQPDGFELVAARVTAPDGEVCELCLWSAVTADQRRRGLMFVTDLGPADGMAFRYPEPHTGRFWMKNTILPLSIAFFAPDGARLGAFDMEPCAADPCLRYGTPEDFLVAVEVPAGRLDELGLVDGSVLELLDAPCA